MKGTDEVYDLEMQATDTGELPKRARYYQGLIDVDCLKSGMMYNELKPQFVIFICLTDVFKRQLSVYHFEKVCTETLSQKEQCFLNDEAYTIFFNCSDYDKIENETEQKKVLQFFKDGKETSAFSRRLKQLETSAKANAQWRQQFMTWEMEMNNKYHEGLEQGRLEEKQTTALKFLEMGLSVEQIAQGTGLSEEEILALKTAEVKI